MHFARVLVFVLFLIAAAGFVTPAFGQPVWSESEMSVTPNGEVRFHGPFCKQIVRVTCDGLGKHDFLEITFDLLIIRSWDGSVRVDPLSHGRPANIGPDFFRFGLLDGPTLLYTTFSNNPEQGFREETLHQNYPSQVPGELFPRQTGAAAANSLGYHFPWPGPQEPVPMDATYAIRFIIPHKEDRTVLELAAMNLQDIIDESWGVANLRVRPLTADETDRPDRDAIAAAFEKALHGPAEDQPAAFQTLILGMNDTADWLLRAVRRQPVNAEHVADLIDQLALEDRAMDAAVALRQLGPQVEPYLRDARRRAAPEQRQRIDWLLQNIAVTPIEEQELRRVLLATRVLEIIGTSYALTLRRHLTEVGPALTMLDDSSH